jgi:hypothetical protein
MGSTTGSREIREAAIPVDGTATLPANSADHHEAVVLDPQVPDPEAPIDEDPTSPPDRPGPK